jgi:hypothetical protein
MTLTQPLLLNGPEKRGGYTPARMPDVWRQRRLQLRCTSHYARRVRAAAESGKVDY